MSYLEPMLVSVMSDLNILTLLNLMNVASGIGC